MTEARSLPPTLPPRLDWTAENLLEAQPPGTFLIRVSHTHVGYTLSYRAPDCCRHFMVKLLDDGNLVIPGEQAAHCSLDALVAFHQQCPLRAHGELITRPCGQDPGAVDYEDLFLYSSALVEEAARPSQGPSQPQQGHSACPAPPEEESPWAKDRRPCAELPRASLEETASSHHAKAPLRDTRQKFWKNLKTLSQVGKRVRRQLKSRLAAVSLPSLSNPEPAAEDDGSGTREASIYTDPFEVTPPSSPTWPQTPGGRDTGCREVLRSASWGGAALAERVVRALSRQVSKQERGALAEPRNSWLPEEYLPPPPFAPGY
ncbi:hematopoietic SH2 domain-containing protein isoform X2 [Tamandua tetradactyla]|uniref:hematopoietic SH2 domain-containing protein isoform X2 n=1 Tax=Tamandua tetradactyla TaxID=48850 RepID=UPI0040544C87